MFLFNSCKSQTTLQARPVPGSLMARKQQGVAIITALLIVTIAATISITIGTRLQLDVRRTSNMIAHDQADFFLLAAEEWSQRILRQDKKDTRVDELGEPWAIEIPPLPVAGGSIQGKLTDLHRCISVNAIIADGAVDPVTESRLTQLFNNLDLKNKSTQAIVDWIDSDLTTSNPYGAEDGYYLNLEKPYRTANKPMQSISEMRLIRGFEDGKDYQLLNNHVCAYIAETSPTINVNTASAEVLKSLDANMTDALVQQILEYRVDKPFQDLKDFTSFAKLGTIIKNTDKLTTSSDYFLLRTQAIIGQANKIMYSIIYRDGSGKTEIISRSYRTL